MHGKAGPGLEPYDAAMLKIMDRHGIPGAALAIAFRGRLMLAKSYGWANVTAGAAVQPDYRFGLASLSKPITAVAILKLIEQGKVGLDDPVFRILNNVRPPTGQRMRPELHEVTVRQCLNHSGGWNRQISGDPVSWEPQICRALRVRPPLTPRQFLSFMLTVPLDFKSGTEEKYSNVGYIVLGEAIARLSEKPYEDFVREDILKPMDIHRFGLNSLDGQYPPQQARQYIAGTLTPLPAFRLPLADASGGWVGSAIDMVRFLTNLDGSRGKPVLEEKTRKLMIETPPLPLKPRENGQFIGLGWDSVEITKDGFGYFKDGIVTGMRTFCRRGPSGVNWVLLYNASMEFEPQDLSMLANTTHEIRKLVQEQKKYPDIDLFKEFE